MSRANRRFIRTMSLGIIALAALVWVAVDQFQVAAPATVLVQWPPHVLSSVIPGRRTGHEHFVGLGISQIDHVLISGWLVRWPVVTSYEESQGVREGEPGLYQHRL